MSVGLGKIQNDPSASVMVRKALGALSTPGLLVEDTGISIDGEGRLYIKLKTDGGILQDDEGLYLEPEEIVIGIDSQVELFSDAHDREWNARLTGSAPNYFEAGLTIGSEDFTGITDPAADFDIPKFAVTAKHAQMRIAYDRENFTQVKIFDDGEAGIYAIGSNPHIGFRTSTDGLDRSGGININNGTEIETILAITASVSFGGGGVAATFSWEEITVNYTPSPAVGTDHDLRPAQDSVTVCPLSSATLPGPGEVVAWTARISATNQFKIKLFWYDILGSDTRNWLFMVHRFST
jgi:hypothetical protein